MEQLELLRLVRDGLEANGIAYGFTGSHASSVYGETRFTNDIDVVVEIRQKSVLDAFLKSFPEENFYVADMAAAHAIAVGGQFNIIDIDAGHKVDVIVPQKSDWPEQLSLRRQVPLADGRPAWFIAPEQVILHKMDFYREGGSEKHLRDIASMLKVAAIQIDRGYIETWADRLGLGDIWREVLVRVSRV